MQILFDGCSHCALNGTLGSAQLGFNQRLHFSQRRDLQSLLLQPGQRLLNVSQRCDVQCKE